MDATAVNAKNEDGDNNNYNGAKENRCHHDVSALRAAASRRFKLYAFNTIFSF